MGGHHLSFSSKRKNIYETYSEDLIQKKKILKDERCTLSLKSLSMFLFDNPLRSMDDVLLMFLG